MCANSLLSDKVALVTGGGGDIGQAIALALAREGSRVAICGRSLESLLKTSKLIRNIGGSALTIKADVGASEDVKKMIRRVLKEWGRLDILVNNAGTISFSPVIDLPEDEWNQVIDVNLTGTFLCSKYAAREMIRERRGGRIVNVSSRGGKVGLNNAAHYSASKFAIIGFTQSLALELIPYGIGVNAVCPGRIEGKMARADILATAKAEGLSRLAAEKRYAEPIPIGRLGLTGEVANVVVFLCSEKASYIVGESINVTGGIDLVRGGQ
jgi:NAD(P)-dependent dehydrogenase (short-subunit alcohol dehydrogenase family)